MRPHPPLVLLDSRVSHANANIIAGSSNTGSVIGRSTVFSSLSARSSLRILTRSHCSLAKSDKRTPSSMWLPASTWARPSCGMRSREWPSHSTRCLFHSSSMAWLLLPWEHLPLRRPACTGAGRRMLLLAYTPLLHRVEELPLRSTLVMKVGEIILL
jgi:hypothetical protein